MTYEQAIAAVKAGTNVKRSSWSDKYLTKRTGTENTVIDVVVTRPVTAAYTSTQDDITANDWVNA